MSQTLKIAVILFITINCFSAQKEITFDLSRNHHLKRLQKYLLNLNANLTDAEIDHFIIKSLNSPTLPTKINESALSIQVLIALTDLRNEHRLLTNVWTISQQQIDEKLIESILAKHPDPNVIKITHENGFYHKYQEPKKK